MDKRDKIVMMMEVKVKKKLVGERIEVLAMKIKIVMMIKKKKRRIAKKSQKK